LEISRQRLRHDLAAIDRRLELPVFRRAHQEIAEGRDALGLPQGIAKSQGVRM
jgi:hypothetical protein